MHTPLDGQTFIEVSCDVSQYIRPRAAALAGLPATLVSKWATILTAMSFHCAGILGADRHIGQAAHGCRAQHIVELAMESAQRAGGSGWQR